MPIEVTMKNVIKLSLMKEWVKHHQLYFHQHFKFHRIIEYFQVGRDLGIWCNALIFTGKLSSLVQTHIDR